jgi:RNA polymerase sigma-70 factor (ECF subfamily)
MPLPIHALPDPEDALAPFEREAEHLLFLVGQQDRLALQKLYEWWSPSLLGIAMRIMKDREEAEEVMQDAFVKLWHRAAEYDAAKSKPFVWCFTILRGVCLDRIRYHRRQKRDHAKKVSCDPPDMKELRFDPRILGSDTINAVRMAVDQLPEDERRCLELAVFLEYTQSEISDELQTPLGTVKHRLRRAMAKLQSMLSYHELTR